MIKPVADTAMMETDGWGVVVLPKTVRQNRMIITGAWTEGVSG